MASSLDVLVIGAGVFGTTAALALNARGHRVRLLDPGPLPHPFAASSDRSKVVRADYGADVVYTDLGARALEGWHTWNARWPTPLYHEHGFLLRTTGPMAPGGYEHDAFRTLTARGWPAERIGAETLAKRFPAWAAERYPDGYLNPRAGWAASESVMARLIARARAEGVELLEGDGVIDLIIEGGRVTGALTAEADVLEAELTVVAAGTWTPSLVPWLEPVMWSTGQPILVFRVDDPHRWRPPHFGPWAADISRTGWYGFPARADGTIKVANHGAGKRMSPHAPRVVDPETVADCRRFLAEALPGLANAPLVYTRLCLYCDTFDGHFWVDHDPAHPGLFVAAGGSGHAFKFAPVLGDLIADAIERRPDPYGGRFAWRTPPADGVITTEAARAR